MGSLPFVWKQSLSWLGMSGCFRTDPDMLFCNRNVLNTYTEMKEVPRSVKIIFGKFPSSIRFNDSVLLSKSFLGISISETFNSSSFIPLTIWEVLVVHSYYMAQITIMFLNKKKKVFSKHWSNVRFWHNYVVLFHYKSKLILYREGNVLFVVLVYISVCGKYNLQCEIWNWFIGSCSSELFLIFMLHCILLLHCPSVLPKTFHWWCLELWEFSTVTFIVTKVYFKNSMMKWVTLLLFSCLRHCTKLSRSIISM